jgi:cyclin G-associated kinase
MTDFFKSAFNVFGSTSHNLQTNAPQNQSNNNNNSSNNQFGFSSSKSNDFVGQTIAIGQYKLRITKMLAEGGFAIVYIAQDLSNGQEYALKRIFAADESTCNAIKEEISYLVNIISES